MTHQSEGSILISRLNTPMSVYRWGLIKCAFIVDGVFASVLFCNSANGSIWSKRTIKREVTNLVIASALNESPWGSLNIKVIKMHVMPSVILIVLSFPRHILFNYIRYHKNCWIRYRNQIILKGIILSFKWSDMHWNFYANY